MTDAGTARGRASRIGVARRLVVARRIAITLFAAMALALALLAFAVPAVTAVARAFVADGGAVTGVSESGVTGAAEPASGTIAPSVGRIASALRFTLVEALLSSVAAIAIGLPAAFFVARREFPLRRFLLSLSGVPLCVPPMIIALAFVLFYGRQGYLNSFLMRVFGLAEPPVTFLYSLAGVVIAHGFYNFPVVLRTVSQVWERLPESEEEAAVLLGASPFRTFRTVTFPRLSGAILSSGVLVFLYCFFSFIIVLLFGGIGGTTLEVELYQAARASLDFRLAGVIAFIETGAAIGIVFAYMSAQRRLSEGTEGVVRVRPRERVKSLSGRIALVFFFAFLLVFFVSPLASILVRSFVVAGGAHYSNALAFSLGAWKTLFSRGGFPSALVTTVVTALAVSLLSTLAALFFALAAEARGSTAVRESRAPRGLNASRGQRRSRALFRSLPLAPLAVSSVALGFGWTLLVPRGNAVVLALAQTAMAWPFAWTQIRTSLDRVEANVLDASALLSAGSLDRSFRVLAPLARRGILSGAAFAFAISAGDASLPIVLSLGRYENLPLMLYRLIGSYRFSEACACAVVLASLSAVAFFLEDIETGER
jgi:thiamine transport system permease protein